MHMRSVSHNLTLCSNRHGKKGLLPGFGSWGWGFSVSDFDDRNSCIFESLATDGISGLEEPTHQFYQAHTFTHHEFHVTRHTPELPVNCPSTFKET